MLAEIESLIELDRTDREVARLSAEVAALPKRIAQIEAKLSQARQALDASRKRVTDIEHDRRNLEREIQSAQGKIGKLRDQSSSVKTNEQYKALLAEIAFSENEIKGFEDKILEGMEAAESLAGSIRHAQSDYDAEAAAVEAEKKQAETLTAQDRLQLDKLQAQRKSIRSGVSEQWLAHYDRVLKNRGSAVAEARDSRCTACNVSLRPQTWNQLLSGDTLLACDSCQRILYTREVPVVAERKTPAPAPIDE